jgi:hypothetical protein
MMTDRPGQEIQREYRAVITYLIDSQGWSYQKPRGGGYPRLLPADPAQDPVKVPKTPHMKGHRFDNWLTEIRRKGGHWPPERQK